MRERYGICFRITGVASRRLGWIADEKGFDSSFLIDPFRPSDPKQPGSNLKGRGFSRAENAAKDHAALAAELDSWLSAARADVLFEATSLNVATGQPAITHIRAALAYGAHAITANKGPIVHAYRELRDLAAKQGRRFLFESTVMDGVPIFSLFDQLPAIHLHGFHGILNSTTNVILTHMEDGLSFEEALKKAQELGIAETDASHDIDGWDAAVKTAALINVLMLPNANDVPIRIDQIARDGIRDLTPQALRNARRDGWPFKLVCRARRTAKGVEASVAPEKVRASEPMARISGSSSYLYFETDIFPGLAITEENPGLYATAYGMLADFIRAATTQPSPSRNFAP